MERVLVTGATGYIGLHCVDQLLKQGLAVCSSGHGGSFNTSGSVAAGPPSARLTSYNTSLNESILTISK